jgi:hypothetical protein
MAMLPSWVWSLFPRTLMVRASGSGDDEQGALLVRASGS